MNGALWKAFLFGVVVAAAIGPIAVLIFDTAARRGFAAGAFAGCGAALADLTWALLAFFGGALLLPLLAGHATAVRAASALLLTGLGLAMLVRGATDAAAPAPRSAAGSLLPVLLLTLVNPMTLVVFAGFAPQLPVAGSPGLAVGLALALAVGSLLVQLGLAAAGAILRATLPGPRWQRAIRMAAALGILAFGLAGLFDALRAA